MVVLVKRKEKQNHKYVAKVEKGKKTRYFYTKEEWWAYLKGNQTAKKETAKKSTIGKALGDLINDGKNLLSSIFKNQSKTSKQTDTVKAVESAVTKLVDKGQKFVSSAASNITTKQQAATGKQYVTNKTNESLNMLLIIPTSWVEKAFNFVKNLFKKDDENTPPDKDVEQAKSLDELDRKDTEMEKFEDQALVNPDYDPYDETYSMNCAYCTAAYDLRRRGYDVEAMPYDPNTYNANVYDIASWYKNTTVDDWSIETEGLTYDPDTNSLVDVDHREVLNRTKQSLEDMPDDSYGQFCVYWTVGGGHSMVWEKENGKIFIRDCQTNKAYGYDDWMNVYRTMVEGTAILRTDNREPSNDILKTVRNREED